MKDKMYYCDDCNKPFPVRTHMDKTLREFKKRAGCPKCGGFNTHRAGENAQVPSGRLSDAPSEAQLEYIKGLGGDPRKARTKQEAGEMIAHLKNLRKG